MSKSMDADVAAIEEALGLVRYAESGAADVGPDVPTAQPSDGDGLRLAAQLAPLADVVAPIPPSDALRRRVFASITREGRFAGMTERLRSLTGLDDESLRTLLAAAEDPHGPGWTDGPGAGIRWYLFAAGESRGRAPSALIFCEPGVTFPEHHHEGAEWALVLDGSARDSGGGEWSLGDMLTYDADTSHSFTTGAETLLAAVVAERGVELVRR